MTWVMSLCVSRLIIGLEQLRSIVVHTGHLTKEWRGIERCSPSPSSLASSESPNPDPPIGLYATLHGAPPQPLDILIMPIPIAGTRLSIPACRGMASQ